MQSSFLKSLVTIMARTDINDLIGILKALKTICEQSDRCTQCFLYDQVENETACLLVKTKDDSLAVNIVAALERLEYIKKEGCIMPECPYCPACDYGHVIYPEDTMPEYTECEWHCLFRPERNDDETDTMSDSLAGIAGIDQDAGTQRGTAEKDN